MPATVLISRLKGPAEPMYSLPENWTLILAGSVVSLMVVLMFGAALDIWLKRLMSPENRQQGRRPALLTISLDSEPDVRPHRTADEVDANRFPGDNAER